MQNQQDLRFSSSWSLLLHNCPSYFIAHMWNSARHDHVTGVVPYKKTTGNPGSVIVPQYGSSKITVFVWGKNTILKFLRNTKKRSMKLTLQLVVVVLNAPTKFPDNLYVIRRIYRNTTGISGLITNLTIE